MTTDRPAVPATPRPAATVVLLRDHPAGGLETYMVRRPATSRFAPDAYVFPGGAVDAADHAADFAKDDHGQPPFDAYHVAAVRELFEEAGILLGCHRDGRPLSAADAPMLSAARRELVQGGELIETLRRHGLFLAPGQLVYAAHFVTPLDYPRRFDVRFFVCRCPPDQEATVHAAEAVEGGWYRPGDLLERHQRGSVKLMPPTRVVCGRLAGANSVEQAIADLGTRPVEPPRSGPTVEGTTPA